MDTTTPSVFIVDDDLNARTSMAALIASQGYPCKTFASGEEFLGSNCLDKPGCVLIDLRLDSLDGIQIQERLVQAGSLLAVILISAFLDIALAVRAMRNGAVSVLEKPCDPNLLADAVQKAINLNAARRNNTHKRMAVKSRLDSLNGREREAMAMILKGMSNKTIAVNLGVSQCTMNRVRANILDKMGGDSTLKLAKIIGEYTQSELEKDYTSTTV